jgi:hypothetical protein
LPGGYKQNKNKQTNPRIVYKNTIVGTAVANVVENQKELDKIDFWVGCIGVFPEHLKELYAETIRDLNTDEAEKTKKILFCFHDFFSKSKDDSGRSSVTRYILAKISNTPLFHLKNVKTV